MVANGCFGQQWKAVKFFREGPTRRLHSWALAVCLPYNLRKILFFQFFISHFLQKAGCFSSPCPNVGHFQSWALVLLCWKRTRKCPAGPALLYHKTCLCSVCQCFMLHASCFMLHASCSCQDSFSSPCWTHCWSRFLRRLRSDLTRSLLILKNELGAT